MTVDYIYRCACATAKVFGTREAEEIFKMRGAHINGAAPEGVCGIICIDSGRLTVVPPHSSKKALRRISMAHMLGHAVLHRDMLTAGECFRDMLFNKNVSAAETEADIFAADFLIDDSLITEYDSFGFTEGQIAIHLAALRPLAAPKIFSMRSRGIPVCSSSFKNNFDLELYY